MNLVLSLVLALTACASSNLKDPVSLGELWEDEILYFQPFGKKDSFEWNGVAYNSNEKLCYQLKQKPKAKKVEATKVKCEKEFLARATEPYEKVADFQKYKSKLIQCLDSQNKECLRKLFSKTMKISFGDEGFGDRRDLVFATWKDADYKRVKQLLLKGVVSEGEYKRFPPEPEEEGLGYRGHFENKNGSWVLASFVAGD